MKKYVFHVWFANSNYEPEKVRVSALNSDCAVILAKARRIKDGLDYTLHSIERKCSDKHIV